MRPSDVLELIVLAALWGASFLFMRVAAPAFGPVALIAVRVGIAALVLLPVLALRGGLPKLRGRVLGLALGFAGVAFLFWGRASFKPGGAGLAVAAALAATLSYGVAASYAKRRLAGVDPLAVAAGSQLAAALLLLAPAAALWPSRPVGPTAWGAVLGLGVACTAVAYVLYFRLIAHVGPARAIAVTFLIPPFAITWGALFLGETLTPRTIAGAAIVLAGTALATGLVKLPAKARAAERNAPPRPGATVARETAR